MEKKNTLTNEELTKMKKFKNNFELVNYAIQLAENMIKTGRDPRVKSDKQNRAMLILEEIEQGLDRFDEVGSSDATKDGIDVEGTFHTETVFEEPVQDRRRSRPSFREDQE